MALIPCLDCGWLAQRSRCRICTSVRNRANPYQEAAWRRVSRAVTARDGACVPRGSTHYLSAHHVLPRAQGGPDASEEPHLALRPQSVYTSRSRMMIRMISATTPMAV
jgi:hypothetical protein